MKIGHTDIAIILASLLIVVGTALTVGGGYRWLPQDLAAIPGLFFLIAAVFVGASLVGRIRIRISKGVNLFGFHKKVGVFFAILMIVTFFHGVIDRIVHSEIFFWQHPEISVTTVHGWVGLAVMILGLVQIIPSLTISDRRKIRSFHKILGYALLILVIVEVFLGIGTTLAEMAGD